MGGRPPGHGAAAPPAPARRVEEINLQSFYEEVGEESYLREPLAAMIMREEGVPAPDVRYVHVRRNGATLGLFAFVEQVDDTFLRKWGLPPGDEGGLLFKARTPLAPPASPGRPDLPGARRLTGGPPASTAQSTHGELSNLRWDVDAGDMQFSYRKMNRGNYAEDWGSLKAFAVGLGGGGPGSRTDYVLANVDVPQVVNEMAVQVRGPGRSRASRQAATPRDPPAAAAQAPGRDPPPAPRRRCS